MYLRGVQHQQLLASYQPPPKSPVHAVCWLMRVLGESMTSGAFLTPNFFLTKQMWYVFCSLCDWFVWGFALCFAHRGFFADSLQDAKRFSIPCLRAKEGQFPRLALGPVACCSTSRYRPPRRTQKCICDMLFVFVFVIERETLAFGFFFLFIDGRFMHLLETLRCPRRP
jgi:hypothetical protein